MFIDTENILNKCNLLTLSEEIYWQHVHLRKMCIRATTQKPLALAVGVHLGELGAASWRLAAKMYNVNVLINDSSLTCPSDICHAMIWIGFGCNITLILG